MSLKRRSLSEHAASATSSRRRASARRASVAATSSAAVRRAVRSSACSASACAFCVAIRSKFLVQMPACSAASRSAARASSSATASSCPSACSFAARACAASSAKPAFQLDRLLQQLFGGHALLGGALLRLGQRLRELEVRALGARLSGDRSFDRRGRAAASPASATAARRGQARVAARRRAAARRAAEAACGRGNPSRRRYRTRCGAGRHGCCCPRAFPPHRVRAHERIDVGSAPGLSLNIGPHGAWDEVSHVTTGARSASTGGAGAAPCRTVARARCADDRCGSCSGAGPPRSRWRWPRPPCGRFVTAPATGACSSPRDRWPARTR